MNSLIHSFIQAISIAPLQLQLQGHYTTRRRSRHSTDTVPEFHAEAPQATVSEGLAQGPYVAARLGVQPMTIQTKGVDSTSAPPRPTMRNERNYSRPSRQFGVQQRREIP